MSTAGSISAAVAVSKLLGLTEDQTVHAIGLVATQVVGLREMFGSQTKSFHPGRAAQNGLLAAILAQGGYTSSETAIEAKRGWAHVVGVTKTDLDASLERWLGFGKGAKKRLGLHTASRPGPWETELWLENSFKPFPCGIIIHPTIDRCVEIHEDLARQSLKPRISNKLSSPCIHWS